MDNLNVSLGPVAPYFEGLWFWNTIPQIRFQKVNTVINAAISRLVFRYRFNLR